MARRKPSAAKPRRCTRHRVGKVSVYWHHAAWWIDYREGERSARQRVGLDQSTAQRLAAEINAQLTAAVPTLLAFEPISVLALREQFLAHHEQVLRSSVATIQRYRAATSHLLACVAERGIAAAHTAPAPAFVAFLRTRRVSPNGHANTPVRRLRDNGLQFILETCRALYARS
jgi:integrase